MGWTVRVRFPTGSFSPRLRVRTISRAYPASYPVGTMFSFPGVKRPDREADYSPASNAKDDGRSYTSTPPYVFRA